MKKTILVDMDGVLADVYSRFFELHKYDTCQNLSIEHVKGLLEAEAFPDQIKWVTAKKRDAFVLHMNYYF